MEPNPCSLLLRKRRSGSSSRERAM